MAKERCTPKIHRDDPNMLKYDWAYYKQLLPYIKGEVLDIGCGAGTFITEYVKKPEVVSVFGIDKYIVEVPKNEKVHVEQFNIPDDLGISDQSAKFDTIVSTEFVEHIEREKLEPLLEFVKASLNPDGVFVGSTPNKIAPTRNEFHLHEYTLNELLSIFRGFFGEVEMWDNGQNCINFVCKL